MSISRWLEGEVGSGLSFLANLDTTPYTIGGYTVGRPQLNEFTVKIQVDPDHVPVGLIYYDQEGCGHESEPINLEMTLSALVDYHDRHRTKSHDLPRRKKRCPFRAVEGVDETRCQLDMHGGDVQHRLELQW